MIDNRKMLIYAVNFVYVFKFTANNIFFYSMCIAKYEVTMVKIIMINERKLKLDFQKDGLIK